MQPEIVLALYYLATAAGAGAVVLLLVAMGLHIARMLDGDWHA